MVSVVSGLHRFPAEKGRDAVALLDSHRSHRLDSRHSVYSGSLSRDASTHQDQCAGPLMVGWMIGPMRYPVGRPGACGVIVAAATWHLWDVALESKALWESLLCRG